MHYIKSNWEIANCNRDGHKVIHLDTKSIFNAKFNANMLICVMCTNANVPYDLCTLLLHPHFFQTNRAILVVYRASVTVLVRMRSTAVRLRKTGSDWE